MASLSICSGVKTTQNLHGSSPGTQGSDPTTFSLHLAHQSCGSKDAITWPQTPLFWPEVDDMMIYELKVTLLHRNNTLIDRIFLENNICTLRNKIRLEEFARNKKMTSCRHLGSEGGISHLVNGRRCRS